MTLSHSANSDQESMEVISTQMEKTLGKIIRERLLLTAEAWEKKYYKIPKFRFAFVRQNFFISLSLVVRVEFANISVITDTYRATITEMRKYFDRGGDWFNVGIEGKENWSFQAVEKYSPVCWQHDYQHPDNFVFRICSTSHHSTTSSFPSRSSS